MNQAFDGQVAVVTGAAQGIGLATATAFLAAGARVALLDIDGAGLAQAEFAGPIASGQALPVLTDISDVASVQQAVDQTAAAYGRIDILINNAAVAQVTFMADVSIEVWDQVMQTNLRGTFLMTRAVIPFMMRQGCGTIVNFIS